MSLPGVGEWTAAETAQRAFGDADALSVGDYHISKMVGWRLSVARSTTRRWSELLEPMRPHRHRAVRLLRSAGWPMSRAAARGCRFEHPRDVADSRGYRSCRMGTVAEGDDAKEC